MAQVSSPGTGVVSRRRSQKLGTLGAVVFVVVAGAAIAFGISTTSDDIGPAHPVGNTFTQLREQQAVIPAPVGNTFTQLREQQAGPAPIDSADKAHLVRGEELAKLKATNTP